VPAKKDPNPGKLKLRLSFFSSLIPSGEMDYVNRRFEYRLEVGRIPPANRGLDVIICGGIRSNDAFVVKACRNAFHQGSQALVTLPLTSRDNAQQLA
jgi:hypothetical protein